jgi:hypothetical protein
MIIITTIIIISRPKFLTTQLYSERERERERENTVQNPIGKRALPPDLPLGALLFPSPYLQLQTPQYSSFVPEI